MTPSSSRRWYGRADGAIVACAALIAAGPTAAAQEDSAAARLSGAYFGPRVGLTFLDQGVRDRAASNGIDVSALVLQFGWQWEQRFVISAEAPILASGFVFLVGGAEQGAFLPSLAWLVGVRSTGGGELGIGPVASLTGMNLAVTVGVSNRYGEVYVPWNVVAVLGKPGVRISLLTGFNMSRRRLRD